MTMDAIMLLKSQHRTVEDLFSRIADSARHEKQRLFRELLANVVAHDAVERELFSPVCERILEGSASAAIAEHGIVEFTLYRCDLERRDASFDVHLGVLQESIEHHVLGEETELFPRVEHALDASERLALGERMERRFEVVLASDCQAALRERLKDVLGESLSARTKRSGDKKVVTRRAGARFAR
jgi:hemerythrin superfamily protein